MAPGAVTLAKLSGAPVMLFGLCARPAIRLKSWDKTLIPLPFGRGVVVFDGPFYVARSDDDEAVRQSLAFTVQQLFHVYATSACIPPPPVPDRSPRRRVLTQ